jgi:hypothetical protein
MRDRSVFLYMEPSPDTPEFAQCGTCSNFIPDAERCFWFSEQDEVDSDDSCGLYVQGDPHGGRVPTGLMEPKVAGFYEGKVRCQNCNAVDNRDPSRIHCDLYVQLNRMMPRIWDLEEKVKPRACCNAFEDGPRDPERFGPYGPIPDTDDPKVGGLISTMITRRSSGRSFLAAIHDMMHVRNPKSMF